MAKQIQFRRGTTTEHETFIGAPGEVTVDTDMNTLRVHDGVTPGGTPLARQGEGMPAGADYVIETQVASAANNYTWYRKYKSGWVEQGGYNYGSLSGEKIIQLPITMSNKHYKFSAILNLDANDANPTVVFGIRRQSNSIYDTASSVAIICTYASGGSNGYAALRFDWQVCGIRA